MPIKEFRLDRILTDFGMDMRQFIDLCILLGCDYCGSIRGIGGVKAYDLIREHKTIEGVLQHIDQTVHTQLCIFVCVDVAFRSIHRRRIGNTNVHANSLSNPK